ncbi:hypothetical protein EVAR_56015_1 [Eumeta japonica]|uniref:Uncharacterized protein n=1 Tax=Eumeta variegata TaxID=151549 RepID=A0A4C1YV21_EUMVA|nr:hypothetical protein EVAR_56015_1 [Eumeta japonica]
MRYLSTRSHAAPLRPRRSAADNRRDYVRWLLLVVLSELTPAFLSALSRCGRRPPPRAVGTPVTRGPRTRPAKSSATCQSLARLPRSGPQ